jgi:hypothetical protein
MGQYPSVGTGCNGLSVDMVEGDIGRIDAGAAGACAAAGARAGAVAGSGAATAAAVAPGAAVAASDGAGSFADGAA